MKALKKILAVAVIAASAQSAFAYWDTGVDTVNKSGVNDGEAVLTLWDPTAQKSYTQDLGVKYSALYSGSAFNGQTINLDATALSVFGGDFSGVNWNIAAANSHVKNGSTNAYTGAGYIYSYQSADVRTVPAGIANNVITKWGQFTPYQVNTAMNATISPANEVRSGTAAGSAATGYQSDWADYVTGQNAYDLVGNSVMNLWFVGFANAGGTQGAVSKLGSVNLSVSGKTLTLNSAAPAVPVPAAAWLMGSALLGLGGIGRSRKQRA